MPPDDGSRHRERVEEARDEDREIRDAPERLAARLTMAG
jgi:hypothetical protein